MESIKMFLKHTAVCCVLLLSNLYGNSQELMPGDTIPDLTIKNLLYKDDDSIRISDLRGKLILLDFWATYCIPCVRNMKKLDSLQDQFVNELKVIAVTHEDQKRVSDFFNRRKESHRISIVTNDTVLNELFPHSVVPHYAWIDSEGKLLATTSVESVTAANISKVIVGESPDFVEKRDIVNYDYGKPLESGEILFRSVIAPYKPGLNAMGKIYFNSPVRNRMLAFNSSISLLYALAFEQHDFSERRLILKVQNPQSFVFPKNSSVSEWRKKYAYCLDIIVDSNNADKLNKIMVSVLDEYFGVSGNLEWIDTTCYVLTRTSSCEKFKSKGEKPEAYLTDESDNYLPKFLRNRPISILLMAMSNMSKLLYVIDESGIKDNVTIEFSAPLDDIEGLNKDLAKYDLNIITARRKVPFIVIKDKALN
jgi:thiol-disulfide isomerase/thioredoxin